MLHIFCSPQVSRVLDRVAFPKYRKAICRQRAWLHWPFESHKGAKLTTADTVFQKNTFFASINKSINWQQLYCLTLGSQGTLGLFFLNHVKQITNLMKYFYLYAKMCMHNPALFIYLTRFLSSRNLFFSWCNFFCSGTFLKPDV